MPARVTRLRARLVRRVAAFASWGALCRRGPVGRRRAQQNAAVGKAERATSRSTAGRGRVAGRLLGKADPRRAEGGEPGQTWRGIPIAGAPPPPRAHAAGRPGSTPGGGGLGGQGPWLAGAMSDTDSSGGASGSERAGLTGFELDGRSQGRGRPRQSAEGGGCVRGGSSHVDARPAAGAALGIQNSGGAQNQQNRESLRGFESLAAEPAVAGGGCGPDGGLEDVLGCGGAGRVWGWAGQDRRLAIKPQFWGRGEQGSPAKKKKVAAAAAGTGAATAPQEEDEPQNQQNGRYDALILRQTTGDEAFDKAMAAFEESTDAEEASNPFNVELAKTAASQSNLNFGDVANSGTDKGSPAKKEKVAALILRQTTGDEAFDKAMAAFEESVSAPCHVFPDSKTLSGLAAAPACPLSICFTSLFLFEPCVPANTLLGKIQKGQPQGAFSNWRNCLCCGCIPTTLAEWTGRVSRADPGGSKFVQAVQGHGAQRHDQSGDTPKTFAKTHTTRWTILLPVGHNRRSGKIYRLHRSPRRLPKRAIQNFLSARLSGERPFLKVKNEVILAQMCG